MTAIEEAFWEDVKDVGKPGVFDCRGVFADWLDEDTLQQDLATALRWCVKHNKRPKRLVGSDPQEFWWYLNPGQNEFDDLPHKLLSHFPNYEKDDYFMLFSSLRAAYLGLAHAIKTSGYLTKAA